MDYVPAVVLICCRCYHLGSAAGQTEIVGGVTTVATEVCLSSARHFPKLPLKKQCVFVDPFRFSCILQVFIHMCVSLLFHSFASKVLKCRLARRSARNPGALNPGDINPGPSGGALPTDPVGACPLGNQASRAPDFAGHNQGKVFGSAPCHAASCRAGTSPTP